MRFPWAKPAPEPPENVRLELADGRIVSCGVVREPAEDKDGMTAWMAVPLEPLDISTVKEGGAVLVDVLPPKTIICFRFTGAL